MKMIDQAIPISFVNLRLRSSRAILSADIDYSQFPRKPKVESGSSCEAAMGLSKAQDYNVTSEEQKPIKSNVDKFNGLISKRTRGKILRIAENWAESVRRSAFRKVVKSEGKVKGMGFLTLTLSAPQIHDDKEIKRVLLNGFLQKLRRLDEDFHFIWRAESQENGNIHFHLIIDIYIDKTVVRDMWNDTQEVLGYVSRFEAMHGHRNPPSTNITSVHSLNAIGEYVSKYIGKESAYRPIEGRLWACSKELSKIKDLVVEGEALQTEIIEALTDWKKPIVKEDKPLKMWFGKIAKVLQEKCPRGYDRLRQHYYSVFDYLYREKPLEKEPFVYKYEGFKSDGFSPVSEVDNIPRLEKWFFMKENGLLPEQIKERKLREKIEYRQYVSSVLKNQMFLFHSNF